MLTKEEEEGRRSAVKRSNVTGYVSEPVFLKFCQILIPTLNVLTRHNSIYKIKNARFWLLVKNIANH